MKQAFDSQAIHQVLAHYHFDSQACSIAPLGDGLINQTFLIKSSEHSLVLQQVNQTVFTSPAQLLDNAQQLGDYLQQQHAKGCYRLQPIYPIRTKSGARYVTHHQQVWRALPFIKQSCTLSSIKTLQQAQQVAQAFAHFSSSLADFDNNKLYPIIKDFHHLPSRIRQLEQAITKACPQRLAQCQPYLEQIFTEQGFIKQVQAITEQLPLRVTHNDTKISNLLFNEYSDDAIAVIDLDTCMPGFLMHDFGDMVRSCCSNLAEDEAEIRAMTINMPLISALAKGYISECQHILTAMERESLITGILLMPFMLASRFFADYLQADSYFHINYPEHNLVRGKNQLHLYQLLTQQQAQLTEIILSA